MSTRELTDDDVAAVDVDDMMVVSLKQLVMAF